MENKYAKELKKTQEELVVKDDKIAMYKKLYEEIREASRREERLLASAFYDIGSYLGKMKRQQTNNPGKPPGQQPFLLEERNQRKQTFMK